MRKLSGQKEACPFRWPGQYEDRETGLYYNRFRYYDPDSGEYLSQDPIGLDGGLSVVSYVDDPLVHTDFLGLSATCGSPALSEKKKLMSQWGKGTFQTRSASVRWHLNKHGGEVGADNAWTYLRKASGFDQNLRGAIPKKLENGATRFSKAGKYIIKDANGRILSFGLAR